jgi:AGZA family xanthine/uracil permease-like MFS transporter
MDVFDTVGTLAGLAELGGFVKNGKIPKANRVLLFDAIGTCLGASLGTSTVTSYIESASGIANGARSGFTSVVVGFLFLISIFFSPIVSAISGGYKVSENVFLYPITAPILIIVGMLMLKSISKIDWDDYTEFIPAFIATIVIPFSFSISTGIALSFVSYAILKLFSKRAKEVSWLVYLLAIIFLIRFIFLKILY